MIKIKQAIKNQKYLYSLIKNVRGALQKQKIKQAGANKNIKIEFSNYHIDLKKTNHIIRINNKHFVYCMDIINSFDYYLNSVLPVNDYNRNLLIDFSTPRYHNVIGYENQPILFPSLAEPVSTTSQYINFANLKNDSVVLDLGSYSGLTSMLFKDICSEGVVIAVDADELNLKCMQYNFSLYKTINGKQIEFLAGAIWKDNQGLNFSNEGNMGSSAVSIIGERGGAMQFVNSFTLSDVADQFSLNKIDFIKCDVEGAEAVIFEDDKFFNRFKPRIIVEPHFVNGVLTTDIVKTHLKKYGYKFNLVEQHGYDLPLLQCHFD